MEMKSGCACRQAGFTLVELMVTITIIMITVGGGAIYIGNFNNRQKVQTAKAELVSALKQARDIARASQKPASSGATCVQLKVSGNNLSVQTDGGSEYFNRALKDTSVSIVNVNVPCFSFFSGVLVRKDDYTGVWGIGDSSTYTISTAASVGDTAIVIVDPSGRINE